MSHDHENYFVTGETSVFDTWHTILSSLPLCFYQTWSYIIWKRDIVVTLPLPCILGCLETIVTAIVENFVTFNIKYNISLGKQPVESALKEVTSRIAISCDLIALYLFYDFGLF